MFGNQQNQRIAELEEQNRQWQMWYLSQQMPQALPPQNSSATKKKKSKANKVNPNPLSTEAKMWLFIILLTLFSILVIKDWFKSATTPDKPKTEKAKR